MTLSLIIKYNVELQMQNPREEKPWLLQLLLFPIPAFFSQGVTVALSVWQAQNINVCLFRGTSNVFVLCVSRATDQNRQGNS